MNLTVKARVGKKYAIYLPKALVETIGLREGEGVLLRTVGNTIVVESLQDPIKLALSGKKFASIKPEEIEEISLEQQAGHIKGSS